ncbi:uncharacterized protein LOC134803541 [Cydia splendana]|uniref:uncharacterized protein LOC134803541 n=1 Tax=Cydia splendana TaxID=1100963 RepID=UPI00300D711C
MLRQPEPLPLNLTPGLEYIYYDAANGSMKLHPTPATWSEARLKCFDEGAELASPENAALLATMSRVLLTSRQPLLHVFTGINDLYSKGFFTSLKGIPLKKMAATWAPREPDNVNHFGNCLIMQRSGPLLDSKCDDMYPYICYKRQPPSQVEFCGTTDTAQRAAPGQQVRRHVPLHLLQETATQPAESLRDYGYRYVSPARVYFGNCLITQRSGPLLDSKCDDIYPYISYKRQPPSQLSLCGTTDTEYVYDKLTKTCHKIHSQFVSWQVAYATCATEGGHLAIVNSEYEAKTLARLIKSEWIWAHIGFSYWRKDLWVTVHGETLAEAGYEAWAPGEPNDWNEERCGSLAADVNTLVDIDCLDHARPFICEISNSM